MKTLKNDGFIALVSVIIISSILLILATTLSLSSFYARSNILDSEIKETSSSIAKGCVDTAVLELADNLNFSGNKSYVNINRDSCLVSSVTTSNGNKTFKVQSVYQNSYTNIKTVLHLNPFSIVSMEEVPSY